MNNNLYNPLINSIKRNSQENLFTTTGAPPDLKPLWQARADFFGTNIKKMGEIQFGDGLRQSRSISVSEQPLYSGYGAGIIQQQRGLFKPSSTTTQNNDFFPSFESEKASFESRLNMPVVSVASGIYATNVVTNNSSSTTTPESLTNNKEQQPERLYDLFSPYPFNTTTAASSASSTTFF